MCTLAGMTVVPVDVPALSSVERMLLDDWLQWWSEAKEPKK